MRGLDDIPRTLRFPVNSVNIQQNDKPIEHLQMTHYAYEKEFAPKGHSVGTFAINQFEPELAVWEKLMEDRQQYKQKKIALAGKLFRQWKRVFPI